jgi:hypothetical protein
VEIDLKDGGSSVMVHEPGHSSSYVSIFITHFFGNPAENQSILRKLYLDFDLSSSQIASITGFARTTISQFFKSHNIKKETQKSPNAKYGERTISGGIRIPHNTELQTIKKILDLRKDGTSYIGIATKLNELGVKTKQGRQWSKSTVQNIVDRHKENGL